MFKMTKMIMAETLCPRILIDNGAVPETTSRGTRLLHYIKLVCKRVDEIYKKVQLHGWTVQDTHSKHSSVTINLESAKTIPNLPFNTFEIHCQTSHKNHVSSHKLSPPGRMCCSNAKQSQSGCCAQRRRQRQERRHCGLRSSTEL